MKIEQMQADGLGPWQEFVDRTRSARAYHHAGWYSILRRCFRVEPFYLQAVAGSGEIRGILPLYLSSSIFTGRILATMEEGVLSEDPEVGQALYREALAIRDQRGCRALVTRDDPGMELEADESTPTLRTILRLDQPFEDYWASLNRHTRKKIRKAKKNGLTVVPDIAELSAFYRIYASRVHQLGTPVMSWCMMREMRESLGEYLRLYMVYYREEAIGGMLFVNNKTRWSPIWLAIRRDLQRLFPTYLLYSSFLKDAYERGVESIDLGRSIIGSGNHRFKGFWRGEDIELSNRYYRAGKGSKMAFIERLRAGQDTIYQRAWRRLPLSVANRLGPVLRRGLPFPI